MKTISSSEWEVMRVLWAKRETTSSEVIAILSAKQGWSASTIKTLIGRLADKGYIHSHRRGRSFIYHATLSEEEANNLALDDVFGRICVTKHSALIYQLIEKTPMTAADIQTLEALLLAKKDEAVEEVVCHCVPGQCNCHSYLEV
ncbi:CopY/TcrY family copper transport repressor [Streptococcus dentiloxodontae]